MGEFYGNQHTSNETEDYGYDDLVEAVAELGAELERPPRTAEAAEDERFPSIATIYRLIEDDWQQVLSDAGIQADPSQVGAYDEDDREAMLADMRRVHDASNSNHLTSREYRQKGDYASSTVKEYFGSWGGACSAAGVRPGTKHGERCLGPNGERLESRHEQAVAYILDHHGVEYEIHPSIPDTVWVNDFLLVDSRIWIEVNGYPAGERPNATSFAAKLDYLETRGFSYVVLNNAKETEEKLFIQPELRLR